MYSILELGPNTIEFLDNSVLVLWLATLITWLIVTVIKVWREPK